MRDYRQQTAGLRGAAKGLREIDMPKTAEQMEDAADAIEEPLAKVTDIDVGNKWKREMPTESGWYWVVVELVKGKREMFPAYFDAEYFEMQSIEGGIACELVGVTHVMSMRFPEPPKEDKL